MSDVFDSDNIIDREAWPADVARVAAVVASDFRFAFFGSAASAVRLLRLDQKLIDGIPMNAPHGERAQHQAGAVAGILRAPDNARR
jgi:hypothetical protein